MRATRVRRSAARGSDRERRVLPESPEVDRLVRGQLREVEGDAGGADFADVSAFDIITPAAGTVEVSANGLTYTGQVNLTSAGVTYNIPAEISIPLTGGNGISLDADETGHKIVIKLDGGGLPSSLLKPTRKKRLRWQRGEPQRYLTSRPKQHKGILILTIVWDL